MMYRKDEKFIKKKCYKYLLWNVLFDYKWKRFSEIIYTGKSLWLFCYIILEDYLIEAKVNIHWGKVYTFTDRLT